MGTQQILLIVLSVIIVGVAIAVGITMFRNQAINANAQAIAAEATTMRTEVIQFFKTPLDQGGGGGVVSTETIGALKTRLGLDTNGAITKPNVGQFVVTIVPSATTGHIGAMGVEKKGADSPTFSAVFNLVSGDIVGTATSGFGTAVPAAPAE